MDEIRSVITQGGAFKFEEAARYFKGKITLKPSEFYKMAEQYRSLAFTVSNYSKLEVLNKFREELLRAIEDGETMATFKERMDTFLVDQGYKGTTPFQVRTIFETNIQTAYQVGHYDQMTDPGVQKLRPYWQYQAVRDSRTRPAHLEMDGKVFPADSPVWDTWYPPNGFKCRCTVTSLSARQVRERGLKVEHDVPLRVQLPDGRLIVMHPDVHFAYNPAKRQWSPDLTDYPEPLKKAYATMQKGGKAKQAAKKP